MNGTGNVEDISADTVPQGRLPSDAEIVEAYVTGRDTSELAKTKAELAYMSMALDRELGIVSRLEVETESLRDRLDFAEFEWRRATDGMKERDTEIQRVRGYVSRWKRDPAVHAALHSRPGTGLDELLSGITEENLHGEVRTGATVTEVGHLREVLEHVTELLVDTWHTAMDGDPEKEAAVVDARAALATEGSEA